METGESNKYYDLVKSPDESSYKSRKIIETYFLVSLFCLIVAIILLSFNLNLISGCLIIAAASLGLIAIRKTFSQNRNMTESLIAFSSQNEKKDDVIKDFSHKIREPLNHLVIIGDMLMESGLHKKQQELLETLIASTNNMVTTVNELTMQSAGNLSFEHRKAIRFNLLSTIQNTIELFSFKDNANIDFILNEKGATDFEYYGDPIILKQIFLDLFSTIKENITERSAKVTINLSKSKVTGSESIISLRIQVDKNIVLINESSKEKCQAARLIYFSKGTFSQNIGSNSTVLTLLLPFINPDSEPKKTISSFKIDELRQKEKAQKELKDLKVLLVEDNLINQKITLLTLKPLVSSIDTASNGKEALDKFGTANYDLILMDIQMPVMSGLIAAEKIRALESSTNSHIPVIAITANAMIGDKEKCLSAGFDDYISKPFQPAALIELIKKNL